MFKFLEQYKDKEKKAKLLFWLWIISILMLILGYAIIFYVLVKNR